MSGNPYVRDGLSAVRENRIEVEELLDQWLATLADALGGDTREGPQLLAYDLLALAGRLKRVRPELLASVDVNGVFQQATHRIGRRQQELVSEALEVPNPAEWREEAQRLSESYERPISPIERARWARELIEDLDDAELVLEAATRVGNTDSKLAGELQGCRGWIEDHAADFLAAGTFVQTVGLMMRPDLAAWDEALAGTAEKFLLLLDAVEDAEAELSFESIAPLDRGELIATLESLKSDPIPIPPVPGRDRHAEPSIGVCASPAPRTWIPEPSYAIAAAGPPAPVEYPVFRWFAPDGSLTARLTIPPTFRGGEDEQICVEFQGAEAERPPATQLSGSLVKLDGVPARVNADALAFFRAGELRAAGPSALPTLELGDPPVRWSPAGSAGH
ncbi:MAG: hypothetical protein GXY83_38480 [Rhodopirellula sp.]|nr:hypothetical protein [Rhodopirellula sp.]